MLMRIDTRYSEEVDQFQNRNEEMEGIKCDGRVRDYFTRSPLRKVNQKLIELVEFGARICT